MGWGIVYPSPLEAESSYEFECQHCEKPTSDQPEACAHATCNQVELCIDCRDLCDLCNFHFCPAHIVRVSRPDGKAPHIICRECIERIAVAAA